MGSRDTCLLRAYYVLGTVLRARGTRVRERKVPAHTGPPTQ